MAGSVPTDRLQDTRPPAPTTAKPLTAATPARSHPSEQKVTPHRESTSGFEREKTKDRDNSYVKDLRVRLRKEFQELWVDAGNRKVLNEHQPGSQTHDGGVAEGGDQ